MNEEDPAYLLNLPVQQIISARNERPNRSLHGQRIALRYGDRSWWKERGPTRANPPAGQREPTTQTGEASLVRVATHGPPVLVLTSPPERFPGLSGVAQNADRGR